MGLGTSSRLLVLTPLAAGAGLAVSNGAQPPGLAAPPRHTTRPISIVEPLNGARLHGRIVLAAKAAPEATSVDFEWSRDGGSTWSEIARDSKGGNRFLIVWDSRGVDGRVIVRATDSGGRQTHVRIVLDNTAPTLSLTAVPATFSPNRDSVKDRAAIRFSADEAVSLTLQIVSPRGRVVYTDSRDAPVASRRAKRFDWLGGLYDGTIRAPDGVYSVRAVAADLVGNRTVQNIPVRVDTRPPRLELRSVTPERVVSGNVRLDFAISDASALLQESLVLYDQSGAPVLTLPPAPRPPGGLALSWIPRAKDGSPLVPGAYLVGLVATDEAGNRGASTPKPFLVEHAVSAHVWSRFLGVGRRVALTFDDCYDGYAWGRVLDTLAREGVRATFFCPGQAVLANSSLALRTVQEGHAIGSHGWDHADFSRLSYGSSVQRLVEDREIWWRLAHVAPTPYFRPPYGSYTASTVVAAGAAGYAGVILWDVDPRDWTRPGSAAIESRVVRATRDGSIDLMHTLPQTADALPAIIGDLRARGFSFATIPELARIGTPISGGWPAYSLVRRGR